MHCPYGSGRGLAHPRRPKPAKKWRLVGTAPSKVNEWEGVRLAIAPSAHPAWSAPASTIQVPRRVFLPVRAGRSSEICRAAYSVPRARVGAGRLFMIALTRGSSWADPTETLVYRECEHRQRDAEARYW
jgi:hypothetical protein